jgi:hypothetical protein
MRRETQICSISLFYGVGLFVASHALIAAPAAGQTSPPGAKVVESRVVKLGDTWTFRQAIGTEYTVKAVEVSDAGYVLENTLRPGVRTLVDRYGVATKLDGDPQALKDVNSRLILGWKFIDFPMWPGKNFSYRVEGSVAWFSIDVKGVKWEKVTVPAGAFEALRIEACYLNESSRWYGCGMTFWYAPEAKTFVKRRTPSNWARSLLDTDFELVRFMPGGGQ